MSYSADSPEALQAEIDLFERTLQVAADAISGYHDPERSLPGAVVITSDVLVSDEEFEIVSEAMNLQHRQARYAEEPPVGAYAWHSGRVHGLSLLLSTRIAEHTANRLESQSRESGGDDA